MLEAQLRRWREAERRRTPPTTRKLTETFQFGVLVVAVWYASHVIVFWSLATCFVAYIVVSFAVSGAVYVVARIAHIPVPVVRQ